MNDWGNQTAGLVSRANFTSRFAGQSDLCRVAASFRWQDHCSCSLTFHQSETVLHPFTRQITGRAASRLTTKVHGSRLILISFVIGSETTCLRHPMHMRRTVTPLTLSSPCSENRACDAHGRPRNGGHLKPEWSRLTNCCGLKQGRGSFWM